MTKQTLDKKMEADLCKDCSYLIMCYDCPNFYIFGRNYQNKEKEKK